jgi:hypothetical protein
LIVTKSFEGGQDPLDILHRNTFAPTLNAVTGEVGEEGVVTTPVPDTNVQLPVPTVGVFAANTDEEEQIV